MARDASVEAATQDESRKHAEHVTIDQIVAYNMRQWRIEAGMTQEELGELLGLSAANVSATERSADLGRDRRRFDAQMLTELSIALSVPLVALFLPPDDDGLTFSGPHIDDEDRGTKDGRYSMRDLMALVVMTDSEDDAPAMNAYRRRFIAAVAQYLDPDWAKEVARWFRARNSWEVIEDQIQRFRAREAEALRIADEYRTMALAFETEIGEDSEP
jgi:transcriptional regulator with XRE-family HTH domain